MQNLTVILAVVTVVMVILAISLPWLSGDTGAGRLKALTSRRDDLRKEAGAKKVKKNSFREIMLQESFSQRMSKKLNLVRFVDPVNLRQKLNMAGWRGRASLSTYLMFRFGLPLLFGGYMFFMVFGGPLSNTFEGIVKPMVPIGAAVIGFFLPALMLTNSITKRGTKLSRQFPDALDLMLVCVEAGLSMDLALIRVTEEIGQAIPEVSEEFAITAAELSYLGDRYRALDNMAVRTGNAEFKAFSGVLIQAERQGSAVADAIRTISSEARLKRVNMIEKKAAGLGPKMTVPMILFILPCMFLILMGPSVIKVMALP